MRKRNETWDLIKKIFFLKIDWKRINAGLGDLNADTDSIEVCKQM